MKTTKNDDAIAINKIAETNDGISPNQSTNF